MNPKTFKEMRNGLCFTMQQMADFLGCSKSTVSRYEAELTEIPQSVEIILNDIFCLESINERLEKFSKKYKKPLD